MLPKENRVTQVRAELINEVSTDSSRLLLSILSGPIAFVVVWLIPLAGLNPNAHFGLSAFAWTLAWWVLTSGSMVGDWLPAVGAVPDLAG